MFAMIGFDLTLTTIDNILKSIINNLRDNTPSNVTTIGFLFAMMYSLCLTSVANRIISHLHFIHLKFEFSGKNLAEPRENMQW